MPEFELFTQGTSHRLLRNGQPMWPGEAVIVLNYQAGEIARLEKELAEAKAQRVPDDVAKDAERFRWLNDHSGATWEHNYYARGGFRFVVNIPFELDDYSRPPVDFRRAIDSAMLAAAKESTNG